MQEEARLLKLSDDGSHTIVLEKSGLSYHSIHGAIQESQHVFIKTGLQLAIQTFEAPLNILELGFGTGLNAFLTALATLKNGPVIHYHSLEAFPLEPGLTYSLNYSELLGHATIFRALHDADWGGEVTIHENFILEKQQCDFRDFHSEKHFQLIYFDAFAPEAQPALWSQSMFENLGHLMTSGGMMTTYCSKGSVRRAMQAAGWQVSKLPGPPGKREIVRARWMY